MENMKELVKGLQAKKSKSAALCSVRLKQEVVDNIKILVENDIDISMILEELFLSNKYKKIIKYLKDEAEKR